MSALFARILTMCFAAGWMVPGICILRLLLSRCPKRYLVLLWGMVAVRLICPVAAKSSLSLLPENPASVPGLSTLSLWPMWLAGAAVMLLWGGIRLFYLKRRLASAVWYTENVWLCDHLTAPFVMGVLYPRIYLPSGLDPEDARLVLAHERTHVRWRDSLWKTAAYVLLSLYWFHPLLWLAYWLFCRDVELACDEQVASALSPAARRSYANLLITCAVPGAPVPGFGSRGLKTRIRAVLSYRKPPGWALPVFILALVLAAACFLTDAKPAYSQTVHSAATRFFRELNQVASGK